MAKNNYDWNYASEDNQQVIENLLSKDGVLKGHSLQPYLNNMAINGKVVKAKDILLKGKKGDNTTKGKLTLGKGTGEDMEFNFSDDQALASGLIAIARMIDKEYVRDQGFDSPARVAKKAYIRNIETSNGDESYALLLLPLSGHVQERFTINDSGKAVKKTDIVVDELLQMRFASQKDAEQAKTSLVMLFSKMNDSEIKQVSASHHVHHSHGVLAHLVQHRV